jgi:hypothetical protein
MNHEYAKEPAALHDGRKKHRTLKTKTHRAFLGAFAKLRRATISFVMSVCPPARMEQGGSHWKDFREI